MIQFNMVCLFKSDGIGQELAQSVKTIFEAACWFIYYDILTFMLYNLIIIFKFRLNESRTDRLG